MTTSSKGRGAGQHLRFGHRPRTNPRKKTTVELQDLAARAERLINMPLEYVPHPMFDHPEVAETFQSGISAYETRLIEAGEGTTNYAAGLYEVPLLSKADEEKLFGTMNFLKSRADRLRKGLKPGRPSEKRIEEIERLLAESVAVRNHIVRANLRLVVSLAKKLGTIHLPIEELISEGHFPLMRAVELFDFSRGNRFSTYATWAVRNHFLRLRREEQTDRTRFIHSDPDFFRQQADRVPEEMDEGKVQRKLQRVRKLLKLLSERESLVVAARFGLTEERSEQTLSEIGNRLGISKERVRQLALRGIEKLKTAAGSLTGHGGD